MTGTGAAHGTERRPNVLLITLDQFRGDALSSAGHPVVDTPHLDALAAGGVRLSRHYSQAAPCAPGRAALYTGTYQMNNRVVANGTPLDARFDNVALAARRAGYRPAMFGYTDQSIDPRVVDDPDDPRLSTYEGVLPGFDCELDLSGEHGPWRTWLAARGHDVAGSIETLLRTEPDAAGLLKAISCGAVFMGANTYIGNGPNFMVKAIAEERGVAMPSFFGYMLYSGAVLLPLFALVTWVFF